MTLLTADSFDRANSAVTLGSTDASGSLGALAWSALSGTWGISSNAAYRPSGSSYQAAVVSTGVVDVDVEVTQPAVTDGSSAGIGVCARVVDANNGYFFISFRTAGGVRQWYLSKFVAGVETTLGASPYTSPIPQANDVLKLRCSASAITAYVNGVQLVSVTDSALTSGTKQGLFTYGAPGAGRLDAFSVSDLLSSFVPSAVVV